MAGLPAIGCAAIDNTGAGAGRLAQLAISWLLTVEDQAQSRIDAAKLVERQMAGALTKTVGIDQVRGRVIGGSISWAAGIISLEELMLGCVQLVLGCVEQRCFIAMGCNLEPPPPLQHDGNAHRGSDHDDGRGRPPVRDDGREDRNAHAGKDRMPLGARRRLHVFTLTPLGHQGLTPLAHFGNR